MQKLGTYDLQNEGQRLLVLSGKSQAAIAQLCGVTAPAVVRWRKGTGLPRPEQRATLFELLEIPIDAWLKPPNSVPDAIVYNASGDTSGTATAGDRPDRKPYNGNPDDDIPPYPDPPEEDASTLDHMKHLLACIRHDEEHRKLTSSSISKLRADKQRALTMIAKLEALAEMQEDRFVTQHPKWKRLRDVMLRALKPYPEAARAVANAIEEELA